MKILITGGLGFIGSNFIRYVFNKYPDYEVINLDKITYAGNPENLRDIENNSGYKFVKGDICDKDLVNKLISEHKPNAIINFAAETHVDRSILDPEAFIKTNIFGTYILLGAVKKHNIEKFLQISTDEVYGSINRGRFTEDDPIKPNNPYASSKAGAELLVMSYFKTYNLPILITRSSNNYGPYQCPEALIPLFVTNLLENKKVPLYGDGLDVRNWLYVLDNCSAIDLVFHNGQIGGIYNIGGGNEKTNKEITKIILKELDKDENWIEHVKNRPGHDKRYAISSEKITKLGWKPKYDFGEIIKETINWYKNNQNWWRAMK
ncbi:MAG: dTDP-glucose 4,6-dehydratase [Candidatus Portnoybacteria bacterium]|nr:dTDP-glucose 4,6-dehydratase [Candidatus Portnoybacteria bacterium]